ncbi:ABC1 domain-containing protein [Purpureocillium lilacinum]|uniref:ABC1 domain-containing protein n=1 Tax=Purpureocillium lilacinum TaxID=33203 RepID=A0A179GED1_PURLI|nr:ABC1 domain-containing protein [Purpureocillium lilacinum]
MASQRHPKRPPSPGLIPNPLVKKRNLAWTIAIQPPDEQDPDEAPPQQVGLKDAARPAKSPPPSPPSTAAIEAGATTIADHLAHFTADLSSHVLSSPSVHPQLSVSALSSLYEANEGKPQGAHFVIHQHDHPVAGTHYDLRLQINGSSSASWAIMYGLPGDPNSKRLNRNATETRIHSLWNHLIETASPHTGTLLIWDTGTYSVLPRRSKHAPSEDPSSQREDYPSRSSSPDATPATQQALLEEAFRNRKIRLRLHGSKLPDPYVLNLRLTKSEDASGRAKSLRKPRTRRRGRTSGGTPQRGQKQQQPETSESEEDGDGDGDDVRESVREGDADAHLVPPAEEADPAADVSALERELRELEDEHVRRSNAYPGAHNSIGSIHQRKWYLSLDRRACGFTKRRQGGKIIWERDDDTEPSTEVKQGREDAAGNMEAKAGGKPTRLAFPFYVRGADYERSVVTGRRGEEILKDEGVTNFIPRKGWTPVLN